MGKTAFIWDLDGTLLDSYKVIVPCLQRTLQEFGIDTDEKEINQDLIDYSLGVFLSKIEKRTGVPTEAIRKRFSEINDSQAMNVTATENAAEILQFLKSRGIPNYVYTHKGRTAGPVLKNLNLYDFFDDMITGLDGFPKKPDPAAINYLVEKYGLDKDSTYYVGDRTLDIACANNAGIKSIMYIPESSVASANGTETHLVKDLLEIKKIIG